MDQPCNYTSNQLAFKIKDHIDVNANSENDLLLAVAL